MAKKHLLYIHDERFEKEQEKSKLVNELLQKHYTHQNALQYHELKKSHAVAGATPKSNELQSTLTCKKHGLIINDGRDVCTLKDCK